MEKSTAEKIEEEKRIREAKEEEQVKRQKKTLITFFIIIGVVIFSFLATWYLINASKHFDYKGVDFSLDDSAKGMTLFKATMVGQVTKATYNFYFRNEPSKLEQIPITGTLIFRKNIVFDSSADQFSCDGNGVLAISQFSNGMNSFGIKLLKENASVQYTPTENYMFLTFVKGNTTEIRQISSFNNAYEVVINNCEILPAMERIMLEAIVKAKTAK
jgi:hypothetical protein